MPSLTVKGLHQQIEYCERKIEEARNKIQMYEEQAEFENLTDYKPPHPVDKLLQDALKLQGEIEYSLKRANTAVISAKHKNDKVKEIISKLQQIRSDEETDQKILAHFDEAIEANNTIRSLSENEQIAYRAIEKMDVKSGDFYRMFDIKHLCGLTTLEIADAQFGKILRLNGWNRSRKLVNGKRTKGWKYN